LCSETTVIYLHEDKQLVCGSFFMSAISLDIVEGCA